MRTSFWAALTDWKCVAQKSGCSIIIQAPCFNEAYICVHAMLETLATYEMEQAKRTRPSKQDQASKTKQAVVNGKTQAVFSRNSSRCPVFFLHKSPHEPFVCEMCRGGTMNRHQPIQQNI